MVSIYIKKNSVKTKKYYNSKGYSLGKIQQRGKETNGCIEKLKYGTDVKKKLSRQRSAIIVKISDRIIVEELLKYIKKEKKLK